MSNASAIGIIAIIAIIATGLGFYYLAAIPQDNQLSSYQTSVSSYQSVVSSMSAHPSTITITSTTIKTTTSISVYTSSEVIHPIPDTITVTIAPSGEFTNYAINAGSFRSSGSTGSSQSISISPVYQNETITVSINLSYPRSTGPTASAYLHVNNAVVSQTNVACGGNTNGQISYVLYQIIFP